MTIWIFLALAGAIALWPRKKNDSPALRLPFDPNDKNKTQQKVRYLESIAALQKVRLRLVITDQLDEPSVDAINLLTMSLTAGNNQE